MFKSCVVVHSIQGCSLLLASTQLYYFISQVCSIDMHARSRSGLLVLFTTPLSSASFNVKAVSRSLHCTLWLYHQYFNCCNHPRFAVEAIFGAILLTDSHYIFVFTHEHAHCDAITSGCTCSSLGCILFHSRYTY